MNKEETYMTEKYNSVLLSQSQTAEVLGISKDTVLDLIKSGDLVPVMVGKSKKFNINDLAKYMRGE